MVMWTVLVAGGRATVFIDGVNPAVELRWNEKTWLQLESREHQVEFVQLPYLLARSARLTVGPGDDGCRFEVTYRIVLSLLKPRVRKIQP